MNRVCRTILGLLMVAALMRSPFAQESVNPALEACIAKSMREGAVKGAALGALGGLLSGVLGRSQDERRGEGLQIKIGVGGGGGSAIGLASRYFMAAGLCFRSHPEWIPESRLERGAEVEAARQALGYQADQGVVVRGLGLEMPERVTAGDTLQIRARFVAFTPDGAELALRMERRLFALADGRSEALPFMGRAQEERRLPVGESVDLARLPIPKDVPAGVAYRYEFTVQAVGAPPETAVTLSGTVTVQ